MWIYLLIGLIILVIIVVGVLFYLRKSKQEEVSKEKERLQQVIQLPFHLDLEKFKSFNLHGEAKELYEQLDGRWKDTLKNNKMHAESNFEAADENLKKFKFSDSKQNEDHAVQHIDNIETMYDELSSEISSFVNQNDESRKLYDESVDLQREANRDVLADGHKFGDSRKPLESLINSYEPELEKYSSLVDNGDYNEAYSHISDVHEELVNLKESMERIPSLIKEVQKDLPTQFQEVRYGCRELRLDGYDLEHIKVDMTLSRLRTELNLIEPKIAKLELEEAEADLDRINNELDDMFDLIEHEVEAKIKYDDLKDKVTDSLFKAKDTNMSLRTEINFIKESYYINDREVQTIHKYEHEIEELVTMYSGIENEVNKNTTRYSRIIDNLEYIDSTIESINNKQDEVLEYLQSLKYDEEEAIDNTDLIDEKKEEIMHRLTTSNLVRIPEQFIVMKHELDNEVKEIDRYLERRPLNVRYIKEKVDKAVILLNNFEQEAYEVIHDAELSELIIQYANRYRKDNAELDSHIEEATRLFNENRYKRSLEIAEEALSEIDKDAVDRIFEAYENR
ncbi:septation ring formation regulator EzrA [Nosocomiicoccus ampullae]|uniref:Septation ring formation regulator n=1 Tax=Nosocomiicoccus ampullae TaxID=489910 RepID=A0A9Q2CY41_9STAP|nr:septation ring formation regulator EzrA [Nosocomiicoccus ampullae]MBB5175270.1 septation ring formation regulator [Nosocomiicoccus ampullae]QYA46355.1 septation ring formation regulator EzrA [Nosocomiicoccus ampullae]